MEFIFAIPILLLPLGFSVMSGLMAKDFGRSFRFWFWISFLLPFISCVILLCLPVKRTAPVMAVENDEVFDHLFEEKKVKKAKLVHA